MSRKDLEDLEHAVALLRAVYSRLPPQSTVEELLLDAETMIRNATLTMTPLPPARLPREP